MSERNPTLRAIKKLRGMNAYEAPDADETSYTVVQKQRTYLIQCNNCEWLNLIASRERYDELNAGRLSCTSCGAIFKERKKHG